MNVVLIVAVMLILLEWMVEFGLSRLNRSYVLRRREFVPDAFREFIDPSSYRSFAFEPGNFAAAFLVFALRAGTIPFWFTPLANQWSPRFEDEADAFAANAVGATESLVGALRKLNEKTLAT